MYILEKARVKDDRGKDIPAQKLIWNGICMHPSDQLLFETRIDMQAKDNEYFYRVRKMNPEEVSWQMH